ncbi:Uncharacterised protein [Mycobacteroides abscessus subsp. abscessus]|nr:Uncharacterised protein [Mycobacteroides abscessus subsp. abscessus]
MGPCAVRRGSRSYGITVSVTNSRTRCAFAASSSGMLKSIIFLPR